MLQYIHDGHQGKERCLLKARNTVFWPKIMHDIQELIERCIICQEHGRSFPYQPFNVIYKKGKDIPVADALS